MGHGAVKSNHMTLTTRSRGLTESVRSSWRILLKEVTAFGLVGFTAFAVDLALFNLLLPHGSLKAKCASTIVSTLVAYLGNKHFSFSHRARTSVGRETSFFFGINLFWLAVSELVLGLFTYPLGYKGDHFVLNVVNLVTIVLGTVFRFWSYKRFVFLHPDRVKDADADLDLELAE